MAFIVLQNTKRVLQNHYHPQYNWMICDISYLTGLTSLFALWRGFYGHSFWTGVVFTTSQIYWRDPNPWMRRIDMAASASAFIYHIYASLATENPVLYVGLLAIGLAFYQTSILIDKGHMQLESFAAHCGLHVFANTAAIALCLGL